MVEGEGERGHYRYGSRERSGVVLSIIVPTYNESENIPHLLRSIRDGLEAKLQRIDSSAEVIIVDDGSPDGTAEVAERHSNMAERLRIRVLRRHSRRDLLSAVLDGLNTAEGSNIVVMDADLSHPPSLIPTMLDELMHDRCDLVIASRYVDGGSVAEWSIRRKALSISANMLARTILNLKVKDAVSGFFACRRWVLEGVNFTTSGYKILLELLVKADNIRVKEIPYTFVNRSHGKSKFSARVAIDYMRAVWMLYRYGRKRRVERRGSVLFLSRAARFYTVGASGLAVNYGVASAANLLLSNMHIATLAGILCSITSNFILNKLWTFEDTDLAILHVLRQYAYYVGLSSVGGVLQFTLTHLLSSIYGMQYNIALILAIGVASMWNFLSNKKWTFREKVWG
ncbi:MAG: glycosyltransferase family 2 protein [Candidatus Nitrosocaldus sp.]|nr:glycosyltransferase family 2 protein [Candidatus Nitrosocaldus sp.]MDW7999759.1 glycosyltransferase family 2 protein [Candidatus Nitrosocaldus sp.]